MPLAGAYKALKENGRTEIKLYSIDISNRDLQLMREAGSPWKVSVAVDPKLIGATNVRLIANKIAGEPTPATYDFKAAAIPRALLAAQPGAVNVASLGKIITAGARPKTLSRRGSRRWKRRTNKIKPGGGGRRPVPSPRPSPQERGKPCHRARGSLCQHYLRIQPQYAADWP